MCVSIINMIEFIVLINIQLFFIVIINKNRPNDIIIQHFKIEVCVGFIFK